MINSLTGLVHLLAALASLVIGTLVLLLAKGTRAHRMWGYLYFYSMLMVNASAFMLYGLFGSFGPFHVAALISFSTLVAGIVPAVRRKPAGKWPMYHFTFMYFSVIGLYAAFASEILTRIPESPFFTMVVAASTAITVGGTIIFQRLRPKWSRQFNKMG
ncbi:MAG: DUF2306 domain-containing protein [Cyclobacteriaceae bacterium]|nr:DUF2306 domain-containing protein [Cyclobacteriaceae bacterium]MCB0500690.1 DUF2306 domain-containing protein [Cyclobacteriaceae bacterium]MCB9236564.1 DUF2306 domain-containing protein [Flammeovirgaceae bacterium]MCO5273176.1 DUF2306 domain-containing protein [Cyclobacteriaceae bacterium]MCW5903229.1 DUF2306 domain-containing protein [Cyclobacteriaceae bacterium]